MFSSSSLRQGKRSKDKVKVVEDLKLTQMRFKSLLILGINGKPIYKTSTFAFITMASCDDMVRVIKKIDAGKSRVSRDEKVADNGLVGKNDGRSYRDVLLSKPINEENTLCKDMLPAMHGNWHLSIE
ncbi:hypothetical protein V6N13_067497 [Hibiscus sabdariffa]